LRQPPNLVTVKRDSKLVDAVAQITKSGYVFVFERETGKPLFPIEYREVQQSEVDGEVVTTLPGPYGENDWVEDYIAQVDGVPIGCVVLVNRDAAGKTKHVVASYRPRSSVLLFSRLLGEKFAGTPIAKHFAANGD